MTQKKIDSVFSDSGDSCIVGSSGRGLGPHVRAWLGQSQRFCIIMKGACVIIAEVQVCPVLQLQACCPAVAHAENVACVGCPHPSTQPPLPPPGPAQVQVIAPALCSCDLGALQRSTAIHGRPAFSAVGGHF